MYIKQQSGEILCKEISSSDDIDDELVGHEDAIYSDNHQQKRIQWIVSEMNANSAKKPIMEVGTACGYILNKVGGDIGLDKRPDRLLVAKRKYPEKTFYYGNILNLTPFYGMGIKTIIAAEILEHLPYLDTHYALIHCLFTAPVVYYTVPNSEVDDGVAKNEEHKWYPTYESTKALFDNLRNHIHIEYDICKIDNFFCGVVRRV
jgi:hypothetical protein